MRAFDYTSAATLDEAIHLLAQNSSTQTLAGGTDLIPLMKADLTTPSHLIDIKRLDEIPRGIEVSENGVLIGALATLADIEMDTQLQSQYPLLSQAAASAATPQLRNMATIGGNLLQRPRCWYFRHAHFHCWLKGGDECYAKEGQNQLHALFGARPCVAVHPSDLASALLAVDARVQLRGPQGERSFALDEFFTLPVDGHRRETTLEPDELLLSIHLPPQPQGARSLYLKAMDRKVWAFALVGVAAWLRLEGDIVVDARLVLSGVAPIPWRVSGLEQTLLGEQLNEDKIAHAAEVAIQDATPLEHNQYKIPLAKSLIRRALTQLAQEA